MEITAEIPGVDKKDIKVNLTNDTLSIKAEKKEEKELTQKQQRQPTRMAFCR